MLGDLQHHSLTHSENKYVHCHVQGCTVKYKSYTAVDRHFKRVRSYTAVGRHFKRVRSYTAVGRHCKRVRTYTAVGSHFKEGKAIVIEILCPFVNYK